VALLTRTALAEIERLQAEQDEETAQTDEDQPCH
jgi:hypothetical protein